MNLHTLSPPVSQFSPPLSLHPSSLPATMSLSPTGISLAPSLPHSPLPGLVTPETVTLSLKSGPAENLETIGTIALGIWGYSATWTPSSSGTYAIEITDESGAIKYSPQFFVAGRGLSCRGLVCRSNLQFTNGDYASSVGAPMTITWDGNDGAVTIYSKPGSADNLETVGTVASGVWGSSATWTPTTSGTFAFEIVDASGNTNYSPQFWVGA